MEKLLTFEQAVELARQAGAKFPEVTAAQFAQETGWGTKQAGAKNNLFNIKWTPDVERKLRERGINASKGDSLATDNETKSKDYYVAFDSIEDSFKGHQVFLETNPRYEKALKAQTMEEYAQALKDAGYMERKTGADEIYSMAKTGGKSSTSHTIKSGNEDLKKKGEEIKSNNKKRKEDYTGTWKGEGGRPKAMIDERNRIENDYISKINEINSNESLTPIQKKEAIENYHKELHQKGDLGIIESFVDKENKRAKDFKGRFPDWDSMSEEEKNDILLKNGGGNLLRSNSTDAQKKEYYNNRRKTLSSYHIEGSTRPINIDFEYPSASLDYYDNLYDSENTTTSSADPTNESGTKTVPDTTYTNLVEGYKGSSQTPDQQIEEDPNAFLQAFGYATPPETMTFDTQSSWTDYLGMAGQAAANISMGIAGMRAANEEAPERDEDISEALLNYAAEQKKISQMGLDPAVEADLKMKLNSAYQFGMENIVRASAGNRNLVLGNQGQLDQAKMQGAMQIALMDVERRDRAMQAYGQVLEYINEFDSRRDIANNERKYREFEKRQSVGMALAEKSFSNLVSDLEHQWENRKGGPNDLMRRKLLSSIMGYDPYAKDDGSGTKVGTKSHAERIASENRERSEDAKQGRAFFNSLDDEGKKEAYKYLKENSELDPRVNPDARFSGFIDAYQNNYKTEPKMQYDDEGNPFLMMTDAQRDYQAGLAQDESPFVSALGEQPSFKSQANPTGQSRFNQSRFGGFDAINSFGLNNKKDPYNLLEQQLFKDVNEEIEQRKELNSY